jgi:hypothetical protein
MPNNSLRLWALTSTALLLVAGCATLTTGVDPMARDAGVRGGARVILEGSKANIDSMMISQNEGRDTLKIVMVNNPTFGQAMKNAGREAVARGAASGAPVGTTVSYTTTERYSPAIFLNQKGTHTLSLVRSDGQQATVVAKPHVGKRYVIIDWLLIAPTLGTSLIVDWVTGKWNMYDAIEVNQYFPAAANGPASARK